MIGNPARVDGARERFQFAEVIEIERIGAADRQRNAVQHDRILLRDFLEHIARTAARVHEVFGERLEPIDVGLRAEDVAEMNGAQPHADAEVREVESIH